MRETGILMPVSSLPSRTGVGELGSRAYEFIKLLKENGVSIWQILPLNPVGYGNSPYQPYSSFAGDECYISLDLLYKEGLLEELPQPFHEGQIMKEYGLIKNRIFERLLKILKKQKNTKNLSTRSGFWNTPYFVH